MDYLNTIMKGKATKYIEIAFILSLVIFCSYNNLSAANLSIEIEQKEDSIRIDNPFMKPLSGHKYIGYLISISNSSSAVVYGGGCDYHSIFELLIDDGYVIQAENTASNAWKKSLLVWCIDEIPPGETRRGWIVFSVPENSTIRTLTFNVSRVTGPFQIQPVGKLQVSP